MDLQRRVQKESLKGYPPYRRGRRMGLVLGVSEVVCSYNCLLSISLKDILSLDVQIDKILCIKLASITVDF